MRKKISKQMFVRGLRKLHLLQLTDNIRYLISLKNTHHANHQFIKEHPDFKLPPSFLAYDAYGHTNWPVYYQSGIAHAKHICQIIDENLDTKEVSICEWGCGPARIIRHIRPLLDRSNTQLYGFDYNCRSITWCQENINDITFACNSVAPPLPCDTNSFDCLFNLSVFTHLSKKMHTEWIRELRRVVKPGGLIIFTTHGDFFKFNLLEDEQKEYEQGRLVVRGQIKEGKRCFVAYHPPKYIESELLKNGLEVISHLPGPALEDFPQDVWVIRNNKPV
jgi:SAM-dependent methyltransferase